jgi:secreted trypsin-like serine protease
LTQGDSGGPLLAANSNIQLGITSYGDGKQCKEFAVFTRVAYYVKNGWIKNNMK